MLKKHILSILCVLGLAGLLPAQAMQAVGPQTGASTSERHLTAELISRSADKLVTTAGSFDIGGVAVEDRRDFKERQQAEGSQEKPKLDLIFEGNVLHRVIIY